MTNETTQCEIPQDIWRAEAAKPRPASLGSGPESRLGIYAFQIANRIKELSITKGNRQRDLLFGIRFRAELILRLCDILEQQSALSRQVGKAA